MTTRTRTLIPTLALLSAMPLAGQELGREAPPSPPQPKVFSFDFEGGSLEKYCFSLREFADGTANVVAPARAEEVQLPAMKLTHVTVNTALEALETIAEPEWRIGFHTAADGVSAPIFSLQVMNRREGGIQTQTNIQAEEQQSEVISLASLVRAPADIVDLEGVTLPAESILTAVQNGLSLAPPTDQDRKVVFHEETALLFVRANREEIRLAQSTVRALQQDLDQNRTWVRQAKMEAQARAARQATQQNGAGGQGRRQAPEEPVEAPAGTTRGR